jgi:predicted  nucleic acid-binding Zn-ribbon protein
VSVLDQLLLVQDHDLELDRLRHRRASLPARSELAAHETDAKAREAAVAQLRAAHREVEAEERKLDQEARSLDAHAKEVEGRLYSGTVSSPRELQAMQADVDMLKRQREAVEDNELEVMERREQLDVELAAAESALEDVQGHIERLRGVIADAEREIDGEIAGEEARRADDAQQIPSTLIADYERRRKNNRGSGAARLVGDTCQACHLSIPATEVERIRRAPEGSVAYCENCGAILVPA